MKRLIGTAVVVLVAAGAVAAEWLRGDTDIVATNPVPLSHASPFRYPIALWDRGVEGETVLMVHVTELGRVDSAYVLLSSGEPAFDSAALVGSRVLRFAPARRGQDLVESWARLPVRFRLPADSTRRRDG